MRMMQSSKVQCSIPIIPASLSDAATTHTSPSQHHSKRPSNYASDAYTSRTRTPVIFFTICCVSLILVMSWTFCQRSGILPHQNNFNWQQFYADNDPDLWVVPWKNITDKFTTEEERHFPLAYSLYIRADTKQALMLLRTIYRRHNQYCVHIDPTAPPEVGIYLRHLEEHMSNLFVLPRNAFYKETDSSSSPSSSSTLQADLTCMAELLKRDKSWQYFINLSGEDYPRKTNLELVRALAALNGTNLIERNSKYKSTVFRHEWMNVNYEIQLWQGNLHIIAVRNFASVALYDEKAIALMEFIRDNGAPDEAYFSTLQQNAHQLKLPGGDSTTEERTNNGTVPWLLLPSSNKECRSLSITSKCYFVDNDFNRLTNNSDGSLFISKLTIDLNGQLLKKLDAWFHDRQSRVYTDVQTFLESSAIK